MKTVTLGFSRASTKLPIFSWIIMALQGTPYSHCYVKYTVEELDRDVYFQASHTLVNYMGSNVFLGQEQVYEEYEFIISDDAFKSMKQYSLDNAGKPYGTLSVFGLGLVCIADRLGFRARNPFKDAGQTFVCSQLAAAVLQDINQHLHVDINDMTPKDMYDMVKKLPKDLT